jgi:hypothetical protein
VEFIVQRGGGCVGGVGVGAERGTGGGGGGQHWVNEMKPMVLSEKSPHNTYHLFLIISRQTDDVIRGGGRSRLTKGVVDIPKVKIFLKTIRSMHEQSRITAQQNHLSQRQQELT